MARDDYQKFSQVIHTHLSAAYGDLFSIYGVSLHNRLEAKPEYQGMVKDSGYNEMLLHKLVRKICNGPVSLIVNDVLGNMLEAMYNCILI